ncbi:MAG: helix-turn-helix transcriptional regulator [Actinobacteria bacterium]|nr:helix-turn-helix transcriptional regulator [Actinomycetota bacterium]
MARQDIRPVLAERFASNVRRLRASADVSQEELAFRADVHRTQVGLIEAGERLPRLETPVRLAGALGVTTNDLVEGIAWEPFEQLSGGFAISPDVVDADA